MNSPRAQTTRLASFEPVFVVVALPVTYFVNRNHICIICRERIQVITPPTRFWCEGGVQIVGVLLRKNGPPTRVCSEGGSVGCGGVVLDY
jgi:hypothetical protein